MEPVYFVMAILGCADDGLQCREQRLEPVRYQSAAACRAAVDAAILRNTDLDYPMISADCRSNRQQLAVDRTAGPAG